MEKNPKDDKNISDNDTEQEELKDTKNKGDNDTKQEELKDTKNKGDNDTKQDDPKDTGSKALISDKKTLLIVSGFGFVVIAIAFALGWILGAGGFDSLNRQDRFRDFRVATVDGLDIQASDVSLLLWNAEYNLLLENFDMFLDGEIDYSMELREGVTFERAIREEAVRLAAITVIQLQYAEQLGITLSDDDIQMIDLHIQSLIMQYGETELNNLLLADGIKDQAHLARIIESNTLIDYLLLAIMEDPNEFARFEQYMQEEEIDEELLAAKHILVNLNDFDSEEEAEEFAKGLWERALAGEDFDMLIEEYGQDPGMMFNPDGYTFVEGAMVPEFEEATRELEIGEISEPVRTDHGLHIILRVEPDENNILRPRGVEVLSLEERMLEAIFIGFEEIVDNADIVFLRRLDRVEVANRS